MIPRNNSAVPVAGLISISEIAGEDEKDTELLLKMARAADAYIRSFSWCRAVSRSFFAATRRMKGAHSLLTPTNSGHFPALVNLPYSIADTFVQ